MKIIRSDILNINTSAQQRHVLRQTLSLYQTYVRDLMLLINARWRTMQHYQGNDIIQAVEHLIHPTSKRPSVKHHYFKNRYYKFPSYLRRVAIMDAAGQVSSFQTRYDQWLDNGLKGRPPSLTVATSTFPSLYKGQCIKFSNDSRTAFIKVFSNNDWIWQAFKLSGSSRFLGKGKPLSPLLTVKGKQWSLSLPTKLDIELKEKADFSGRVLAVDVGINTAAVCAVVDKTGTVAHRAFLDRADKDRSHYLIQRIRSTAAKATRHGNKLPAGFCRQDHRRLRQLNNNEAHQISRRIVELAKQWDCDAVVLENLTGWKPKAGKKRSSLKQKFHRWFKARLCDHIKSKAIEYGIRTIPVYARGTSSFAYDGSGKLRRSNANAALATFASGKQYNADLNAAYNIATRGIVKLYYPSLHEQQWGRGTPNACPTTGNPLVLSSLWLLNTTKAS